MNSESLITKNKQARKKQNSNASHIAGAADSCDAKTALAKATQTSSYLQLEQLLTQRWMLQLLWRQFQRKDHDNQQDAWLGHKKPRYQEDVVRKQHMENDILTETKPQMNRGVLWRLLSGWVMTGTGMRWLSVQLLPQWRFQYKTLFFSSTFYAHYRAYKQYVVWGRAKPQRTKQVAQQENND